MMKNTESDLAYLSGIVDGEGCIYINKSRKSYMLVIQVTSTDYKLIQWLLDHFGGYYTCHKSNNEKYKDVWYWRAKSCDYDIILIGMLPFSVIKRDQIITALNYSFEIKKLPGLKMTDEERSMRYEYYKKLRELKRV